MRGYTQLIREERYQIYILKKDNYSQTEISESIGKTKAILPKIQVIEKPIKSPFPQMIVKSHQMLQSGRVCSVNTLRPCRGPTAMR